MAGARDTFRVLPRAARIYLVAVSACALAAVGGADWLTDASRVDWAVLALAIAACAAGKAFEIFAPGHYALQPNYAVLVFGCLLLPAWAAPILALACFAPDLRPSGVAPYKTVFNIANYTLVGVLVSLAAEAGGVLAFTTAAIAGAVANHGLIVVAIALAGEQPLRGTLHQLTDGLPLSVCVGLMGGVLAVLWGVGPAWLLLAPGPVGLLYYALWVPMLRHRADTDAKTGLYHSERIRSELADQVAVAERVAVAMIDLDHLRTINSRCGHLAGDRAIRAVADELASIASLHGAAGRFGGEEFCLVLPGSDADTTRILLDGARRRLAEIEFRGTPDLRVSFSAGVAVYPDHGDSVDALLSTADAALYDAKAAGRDRVRIALSAVATHTLELLAGSASTPVQPLPAASAAGSRLTAAVASISGRRATDRSGAQLQRAQSDLDDALGLIGRMQRGYLTTITGLARAREDADPARAGATGRVTTTALRLASALGCDEAERRALVLAAALRDVDVADLELPVGVKAIIRGRNEQWADAGESIAPGARILAVAEALTFDGLAAVRDGAGSRFCPEVAAHAARRGWGARSDDADLVGATR